LGGEDAFSIDNPSFQRQQPFLCESKKVTGSQDDGFVGGLEIRLVGCRKHEKTEKVTGSQDDDFVGV
jgi:hypothetical protein